MKMAERIYRREAFEREGSRDAKKFPGAWQEIGERKARALTREAEKRKVELKLKGQRLVNRASEIVQTLNAGKGTRPQLVLSTDYWKGILYIFFGLVLWVSSYIVNFWSLQPFGLGSEKFVAAAGITVVGTLLLELLLSFFMRTLDDRAYQKLIAFLIVTGAVAILASLGALGLIRGMIVGVQAGGTDLEAVERFFSQAAPYLIMVFFLFGIGLELGAALLLHSGWNKVSASRGSLKLIRELKTVHIQMARTASALKELENIGDDFQDHYTAGALKSIEQEKQGHVGDNWGRNLCKQLLLYVLLLVLLLVLAGRAFGSVVVTAVDLSGSSNAEDAKGVIELEKNKKAVSDLLNMLPPGAKIYVIGITEQSFTKPFFIITDQLSPKSGYFGEIIKRDRLRVVKEWAESSEALTAKASTSDVFGAVHQAAVIFANHTNERKILVLLSDMRESADKGFNLEKRKRIGSEFFDKFRKSRPIPSLQGVSVYVLGCHASGKSSVYWEELKSFWKNYFREAGAVLAIYTNLRQIGGVK